MPAPQPTLAQLRPALQLALDTARQPGPSRPGRVRNVVQARRLPQDWMATMAQALAGDDDFRAEVAAGASEEALGTVPWLWLSRPDGWETQLGEALERSAEAAAADEEARRREERIAELEAELDRTRAELERARDAGSDTATRLEESGRVVARLRAELSAATGRAQQLAADSASRSERIGRLEADNAELRRHSEELSARLTDLQGRLADRDAALAGAQAAATRAIDQAHAADERARVMSAELVRVRRLAGDAVRRAGATSRLVDEALAAAAAVLDPQPGGPPWPGPAPAPSPGGAQTGRGDHPGAAPPAATPGARPAPPVRKAAMRRPAPRPMPRARRPVPLPPAVYEESPEAAAHLIRTVGVHLVVDGYNVAFRSWPGGDLPALRSRLIDALSELVVRVKQTVTVVFDGAAEGGRVPVPAVARPWLRVFFSASTEEADEVIVAAVRDLPAEVPVAVATDDRQVRADARALGANVISVDQLLSVLGRAPGPGRA